MSATPTHDTVPAATPGYLPGEAAALRAAIQAIGRRAVGTLAAAVDQVHHEANYRDGRWDSAAAERVLTGADAPALWNPQTLMWLRHTGAWLNRRRHPAGPPRPHTGPKPSRVDLDAREQIATVLRAWTTPGRGVPVAESLARIVSHYADTTRGPDSWRRIADQWLPRTSARPSWGPGCHDLLMARSIYLPRTTTDETAAHHTTSGGCAS
ncbi:hypothetical protein [Nocardia neocaledoniensis]|uniref:hypothetical protein n=1 Tax=Nocardia neocaledoniensis TaxID=236511 RepID=UPI0024589D4B|nr:hypothetical protein [Nocardia neocaledoniensis]